ncbi:MAG: phage holin family protein [Tetrasphaera sp.]
MKNMLIKFGVNAIALWVAAMVVKGVYLGEDAADKLSTRLLTIVLVAVVFGLVNAVVKPIAKVLSFPAIVLTLGLFTFIVNAFMLQITEWISDAVGLDFTINNFFWDAVMAALVITLVSMVLNFVLPDDDA